MLLLLCIALFVMHFFTQKQFDGLRAHYQRANKSFFSLSNTHHLISWG